MKSIIGIAVIGALALLGYFFLMPKTEESAVVQPEPVAEAQPTEQPAPTVIEEEPQTVEEQIEEAAQDARETVETAVEEARETVESAAQEAREAAATAAEDVREAVEDAADGVQGMVDQATQAAQDTAETAAETAQDVSDQVTQTTETPSGAVDEQPEAVAEAESNGLADVFTVDGFDYDRVIEAIDAADISEAVKMTTKAALRAARDNPVALQAALAQARSALGL